MVRALRILAMVLALAICGNPSADAQDISAQSMSTDQLLSVVRAKDLRDVPSVVRELPRDMKNDHFVLMYRSHSLQGATPESPRAILFTSDARFVVAFNGGDSSERGSDTIEMIQFRDQTQSFEFREIQFDGGPAKISEINPQKCTACHQSPSRAGVDMRPNWEPYSMWPGAYGSADGHLQPLLRPSDRMVAGDEQLVEDQLHEEGNYAVYSKDVAPTHPRYSQLGKLPPLITLRLTDLLANLNFLRVARLMKAETEITPAYFPAIEYGLHCNGPEGLRQDSLVNWSFTQKIPYYPSYKNNYDSLSSILSPIYESLGVDTSDWSMDFGTRGRFAFIDRFGTPSVAAVQLESSITQVLGDSEGVRELDCPAMLAESRKKLQPFFDSGENLRLAARRNQ